MRIILASLLVRASGHGTLTYPPSTRHGGSLAEAGRCESTACMWFTQPTSIPGEPILPDEGRTFNLGVSSGDKDWTRKKPWRSPGTAPVFGSGCGISGGSYLPIPNGGKAWPNMPPQGSDGVLLPRQAPTVWPRGSTQEVAWGITANHGGGYSFRLCPLGEESEACFQRTVLRFAGDTQWLQYDSETYQYDTPVSLPRFELPLVKVSVAGSEVRPALFPSQISRAPSHPPSAPPSFSVGAQPHTLVQAVRPVRVRAGLVRRPRIELKPSVVALPASCHSSERSSFDARSSQAAKLEPAVSAGLLDGQRDVLWRLGLVPRGAVRAALRGAQHDRVPAGDDAVPRAVPPRESNSPDLLPTTVKLSHLLPSLRGSRRSTARLSLAGSPAYQATRAPTRRTAARGCPSASSTGCSCPTGSRRATGCCRGAGIASRRTRSGK